MPLFSRISVDKEPLSLLPIVGLFYSNGCACADLGYSKEARVSAWHAQRGGSDILDDPLAIPKGPSETLAPLEHIRHFADLTAFGC